MHHTKIEVIVVSILCFVFGFWLSSKMVTPTPKIDLPEEYLLISKDSTNPDLLEGYFKNDTLIIQFKKK